MARILFFGEAGIYDSRLIMLKINIPEIKEIVVVTQSDQAYTAFLDKGPFDLVVISIEMPSSTKVRSCFNGNMFDLAAGLVVAEKFINYDNRVKILFFSTDALRMFGVNLETNYPWLVKYPVISATVRIEDFSAEVRFALGLCQRPSNPISYTSRSLIRRPM